MIGVAVSSFVFPGLGHALVGRPLSAFLWAVAGAVALALPIVALPLAVVLIVIRIGATVDAVRGAQKYGRYAALLAIVPVAIAVAGFLCAYRFVEESFQITSTSMSPTLAIGDHVLVDKLSLETRDPKRGEVIVFRFPCAPDRDFVKRVVGLPGDLVEVRCDQLWVNNRPVDQDVIARRETYRPSDANASVVHVARLSETLDDTTYEVFHSPLGDGRDFPTEGAAPASCGTDHEDGYVTVGDQPTGDVVPRSHGDRCEPRLAYRVPADSVFVLGDNRPWAFDSRRWGVVPMDHIKGLAMGIWYGASPLRIGAVR